MGLPSSRQGGRAKKAKATASAHPETPRVCTEAAIGSCGSVLVCVETNSVHMRGASVCTGSTSVDTGSVLVCTKTVLSSVTRTLWAVLG